MSELPEQLRFQDLSRPYDAVMYTNKVEPVSSSNETTRFQIPKQGILNSNGIIQFKLDVDNVLGGDGEYLQYPVGVGCRSAVRRATLTTQSGRILQDSRFFNKKSVVETTFRSAEYLRYVAPYLDGSNFYFNYTTPNEPTAAQGKVRLGGVPIRPDGTPSPTGSEWSSPLVIKQGGAAGTQVEQNFRVSIAELFPLFYNIQIPVNIAEYLYIDIYWETDTELGDRFITPQYTTWAASTVIKEPQLICDNLVYIDPNVMMAIEEKQVSGGGLTFPYEDTNVQVVSHVNSTGGGLEEGYDRMLGCNEYKLTCIKNIELTGLSGEANRLLGKYYSNSSQYTRQHNYVLNDVNLYPTNDATQPINYERISQIYDHVSPAVPRVVYGTTTLVTAAQIPDGTDEVWNDWNAQGQLAGQMNVMGVNLKDSSNHFFQNGNSPIRLMYNKVATPNQGTWATDSLQYYFINYLREFKLMPTGKFVVSAFA